MLGLCGGNGSSEDCKDDEDVSFVKWKKRLLFNALYLQMARGRSHRLARQVFVCPCLEKSRVTLLDKQLILSK